MNDILDLIRERHSTRAYTGEQVDREKLLKILEAGRLSPSARNTQPWRMYASNSPDIVSKLADSFDALNRNTFFRNCGAVIAITEEPLPDGIEMRRRYAEYDIGMCIMQLCLEAHSIGVASCILGTYDENAVKAALDIPSDRFVTMVIALGYSAETELRPKNRKSFSEAIVLR